MIMFHDFFEKYKKAWIIIGVLLILSPLFGVYLADLVGYHEPLDIVAEKLGLEEKTGFYETPFADYTVPNLPDWLGYIISGIIGVLFILAIGLLIRAYYRWKKSE